MNKAFMLAAACALLATPASAAQDNIGHDSTARPADGSRMILAQIGPDAGRGGSVAPPLGTMQSSPPATGTVQRLDDPNAGRGGSAAPPLATPQGGPVSSGGASEQQLDRTDPAGRGKSVAPPLGVSR